MVDERKTIYGQEDINLPFLIIINNVKLSIKDIAETGKRIDNDILLLKN